METWKHNIKALFGLTKQYEDYYQVELEPNSRARNIFHFEI
jgi:hypothetical protein